MAELDFEVTDEVDITDKVGKSNNRRTGGWRDSGCPHERWRTSAECSAQHERRRA